MRRVLFDGDEQRDPDGFRQILRAVDGGMRGVETLLGRLTHPLFRKFRLGLKE
jgi:hypothetical protein